MTYLLGVNKWIYFCNAAGLHQYAAIKSQNTVKPNPLCRLSVTSATSRDVPWTGSFGEVGVIEFGLKGTSRLVADVTGSRHSGLGFTVFWLFTAVWWSIDLS